MEDSGSFDETGMMVANNRLLARSDKAAVVVHALTAYTAGLVAELRIYWRDSLTSADVATMLYDDTDGGLRLGFGYRDPAGAVLVPPGRGNPNGPLPCWHMGNAGGGSGGRYDATFTVTPYPNANSLTVVVRWLSHDIETVSARVALPPRMRVHAKSERLWPRSVGS